MPRATAALSVSLTLLLSGLPCLASPEIAAKAGCGTCHQAQAKLLGPSYKDIAAKYKGQASAPAQLADKVRKGSKGVWGAVPMPATGPDKLSDADLKAVISWLLKTS